MAITVDKVIDVLTRESKVKFEAVPGEGRRPVVTVSRTMGSGGYEVAHLLAERLGVECYSREILDVIAADAKVHKNLMNRLHEQISAASDSWLYAVVFGKNVTRDDYLHRLVTTVRTLYRLGGVILGRGGHIILAGRDVLRVRIIGSAEVCARRIAHEENLDLAEARKRVRDSNRAREKFTWTMFRARANDPLRFDLVINTDQFADYGRVVDIIQEAMRGRGMDVPAA